MQVSGIRTRGRSALNAPSENVNHFTFQRINQNNEGIHTNADSSWRKTFTDFTIKWGSRLAKVAYDSAVLASDKLGFTRVWAEVKNEMMLEDLVMFEPYGLVDVSINVIDKMPRALCASVAHRTEIFICKHFEAAQEILDSMSEKTRKLTDAITETSSLITRLHKDLESDDDEINAPALLRYIHRLYCRSLDAYSIGVSWLMLLTDDEFVCSEKSNKDKCLTPHANAVAALRENLVELERIKAIYEECYELEPITLSEEFQKIADMLADDFEDNEPLTLEEFPGNTIPLSVINHFLNIQAYACQRAELLGEDWVQSPQTRMEKFLSEHSSAVQSAFLASLVTAIGSDEIAKFAG